VLFFVTAAIQLFVIEALNRAADRLADEQHRVANNMSFIASILRLQRCAAEARPETTSSVIDEDSGCKR
jgi:two-component sensor histidine kinase